MSLFLLCLSRWLSSMRNWSQTHTHLTHAHSRTVLKESSYRFCVLTVRRLFAWGDHSNHAGSMYLFNWYARIRTSVTLLLLVDTVISQIMNVKNWNFLGLVWLPLRNLFKTLLASIRKACFVAFLIVVCSISSKAPASYVCLPVWKVLLTAPVVIICCRFWWHSCDSISYKAYLTNEDLEIL